MALTVGSFDPSRWEDPSKKMKDAFMAFGTGPRGKNPLFPYSLHELKSGVHRLHWHPSRSHGAASRCCSVFPNFPGRENLEQRRHVGFRHGGEDLLLADAQGSPMSGRSGMTCPGILLLGSRWC